MFLLTTSHAVQLRGGKLTAPGIGYSVKGKFSKVSHWTSNIKGTDHVCAYLFGSHGIVKRVFKTYKIH